MPGENIQDWSTTATSNGNSDSSINWLEGQARASVNNSARGMMAAHAKQRNLMNGSIVTTGTTDAQAFTSGLAYTTIPTGLRVLLKIGPSLTNTGTATLNMDSIGDTLIKSRLGAELAAGEIVADNYSEFRYDGTYWVLLSIGDTIVATTIISPPNGSITVTNLTVENVTVSGDITTNTLAATGAITAESLTTTGNIATSSGSFLIDGIMGLVNYGTARNLNFHGTDFSFSWETASPNSLRLYMGGTPKFLFTAGGNLTINGSGSQPGGGVWADSSDLRIKTVTGEYISGLTEVCALNPVRYIFKGNDGEHAADGKEYVGLVAQDVEAVMPEMVTMKTGQIDGQPVTDLRELNTTALIFALVNSVQDLAARIEELEAEG